MIKIYGGQDTSAGRCYWTLEEVGALYETLPIDFRSKEHKGPEYLRMNPNGKIPVMVDGDFILWESMAINSYLAEKYQPTLLGRTLTDRALVSQWSFWALAEYQKPIIDLFIHKVFLPEAKRDAALMANMLLKIEPLNAILNQHLSDRNYMVTHEFTLADLNVASVARLNQYVGVDLATLPHIKSWLDQLSQRPAYQRLMQKREK